MRHVLYLHGFASSATSAKAAFFAQRLRPLGVEVRCPDFNEPDFSTLTATRMIAQVERELAALPAGPVALIGSSLGGFVAWLVAARQRKAHSHARPCAVPIDRVVLLAPALDFGRTGFGGLDAEEIDRWRCTDRLDVFHYGFGEVRPIRFALYDDARLHDAFAERVHAPTLIFHGVRDEVVDPAMVRRFSGARPSVSLRMVDDDHLLRMSLDVIAVETSAFLGLCDRLPSAPG